MTRAHLFRELRPRHPTGDVTLKPDLDGSTPTGTTGVLTSGPIPAPVQPKEGTMPGKTDSKRATAKRATAKRTTAKKDTAGTTTTKTDKVEGHGTGHKLTNGATLYNDDKPFSKSGKGGVVKVHGDKSTGYQRGCRCDECKAAMAAYTTQQREARKATAEAKAAEEAKAAKAAAKAEKAAKKAEGEQVAA